MDEKTKKLIGLLLRVLAVVADIIAIISVLSFDKTNLNQAGLGIYLTPTLALVICFVSIFTYAGILQRFWHANRENKKFEATFLKFVTQNLFREFREPFWLLPGFILFVLLIWALVELITSTAWLLALVLVIVIFGGALGFSFYISNIEVSSKPENVIRKDVDDNWEKWDKLLQAKLARKTWITTHDLAEQSKLLGVEPEYLAYALSKYAIEHPRQTTYGFVYEKKTGELMTPTRVLISLKNLPRDKFYFSG